MHKNTAENAEESFRRPSRSPLTVIYRRDRSRIRRIKVKTDGRIGQQLSTTPLPNEKIFECVEQIFPDI